MAEVPRKKPGRPRKAASEKPEQFSIRLTPATKLMLEMISRQTNLSLSQVIERAIRDLAENLDVEDRSIFKLTRDGIALLLRHMGNSYLSKPDEAISSPGLPYGITGPVTDAEKAVVFHDSLRTEEERLFYEVVRELDWNYGIHVMSEKEQAEELLRFCSRASLTGASPGQIIESWMKARAADPM